MSCIKENGLLRRLDLSQNYSIGVEGSKAVAAALPNTALSELKLNAVGLKAKSFVMKTDLQGSSFEVGTKVTYQNCEMTVVVPDDESLRRYTRDKDKRINMVADFSGVLALAAGLSDCQSLTSLGL